MHSKIPESILVVGSGVFGLSTAHSLALNPAFKDTKITLIDRWAFPAPDGASIDTSRIIRSDPAYAKLAANAQAQWRSSWGESNRYHETGLLLTGEPGLEAYVKASSTNVKALAKNGLLNQGLSPTASAIAAVQELNSPTEVMNISGSPGASGPAGYINRRSGWADAEAAMRYLRQKVEHTGRVEFIIGTVTRLIFSSDTCRVEGVEYIPTLQDPNSGTRSYHASLIILAAGAWTPSLIDLHGRVQTTAQALAYIPLTDDEASELSKTPTQMNMSSGLFIIPPPAPSQTIAFPSSGSTANSRRLFLKVARHAHGYANPISVPHPEPHLSPSTKKITISVPHTHPATEFASQPIPTSSLRPLRDFVKTVFPGTALATRPFSVTRLCHYADTPTGDFLIDYHPNYHRTLFIATGGSGHGFKFVPVIGDCIVKCIQGECPEEFEQKWKWRGAMQGEWSVEDGSRGGERGLRLDLELDELKNIPKQKL